MMAKFQVLNIAHKLNICAQPMVMTTRCSLALKTKIDLYQKLSLDPGTKTQIVPLVLTLEDPQFPMEIFSLTSCSMMNLHGSHTRGTTSLAQSLRENFAMNSSMETVCTVVSARSPISWMLEPLQKISMLSKSFIDLSSFKIGVFATSNTLRIGRRRILPFGATLLVWKGHCASFRETFPMDDVLKNLE